MNKGLTNKLKDMSRCPPNKKCHCNQRLKMHYENKAQHDERHDVSRNYILAAKAWRTLIRSDWRRWDLAIWLAKNLCPYADRHNHFYEVKYSTRSTSQSTYTLGIMKYLNFFKNTNRINRPWEEYIIINHDASPRTTIKHVSPCRKKLPLKSYRTLISIKRVLRQTSFAE